jgi:hypothetical protein
MGGIVSLLLHTIALALTLWRGVRVYVRHKEPVFAFAASLVAMYFVSGIFESTLIVRVSSVSFYLAMCLALLCISGDGTQKHTAIRKITPEERVPIVAGT